MDRIHAFILFLVSVLLLLLVVVVVVVVKGKATPLQAWTGPEGSRKLRFPDFRDNGPGWW